MKIIKIKYFSDRIDKIRKIDIGDWIDLRSAITLNLNAGEYKAIPLGVGMKLPKGYEAYMAPRGSTFKNYSIIVTNSPGVIDESFCGNNDQWHCLAYALRDTVIHINERICQFRIQKKMPKVKFKTVKELGNNDRGWMGSTGKK